MLTFKTYIWFMWCEVLLLVNKKDFNISFPSFLNELDIEIFTPMRIIEASTPESLNE